MTSAILVECASPDRTPYWLALRSTTSEMFGQEPHVPAEARAGCMARSAELAKAEAALRSFEENTPQQCDLGESLLCNRSDNGHHRVVLRLRDRRLGLDLLFLRIHLLLLGNHLLLRSQNRR